MENIKTAEELLLIAKAEAMGDCVFDHMLDFIKIGMTEKEIAAEVERKFLELGASGLSFPTIAVSGPNSALPHGVPSDHVIQPGEFLTLDMGCIYQGLCSDMTRTIAIGYATEEMVHIYDTVLEAQLAGLEAVKAGVRCEDVDAVCRDIITDAGYGEYFIHTTGHGVGNEVHESPRLGKGSEEFLRENMAVTIEPGIYLPDRFGVRIEDTVIVTDCGYINLAHSPKELLVL